ncbi:hypothetical protein J6590_067686 [Homalodisca vitripennis]|nr:hypothetical protein J6590_067686 [Homalodisca vitripennis]
MLSFSRSSTPIIFPYTLEDQPLSRSLMIKDLGVMLSPNLNPQEHINCICKRANSALYFVIRNSRNVFMDLRKFKLVSPVSLPKTAGQHMPDNIDLFCTSEKAFKKKLLDWKALH